MVVIYSENELMKVTNPSDLNDVLFDLLSDEEDLLCVNKFWSVSICAVLISVFIIRYIKVTVFITVLKIYLSCTHDSHHILIMKYLEAITLKIRCLENCP